MLSVQTGDLYRVKSELAHCDANRTSARWDLHLVTAASLLVITTLCKGAVFTWCSSCGAVDEKSRKGKSFRCVACGHVADADLNAALNIKCSSAIVDRGEGALFDQTINP